MRIKRIGNNLDFGTLGGNRNVSSLFHRLADVLIVLVKKEKN